MKMYIIRHGEPDYATDRLTQRGWAQAEAVGKRLANAGIDRIFTSPMGRARETAMPACRILHLAPSVEQWAHEIEDEKNTTFPDGKVRSVSLVQNTYFLENGNYDLRYSDAHMAPGIRDSALTDAAKRIEQCGDQFLERLGYRKENDVYRILRENTENVALFCHAAMARAWISRLLRIPLHVMWASFDYGFTGVTEIEFVNNANGLTAPRCLCYADTYHLQQSDLL